VSCASPFRCECRLCRQLRGVETPLHPWAYEWFARTATQEMREIEKVRLRKEASRLLKLAIVSEVSR
jgi:hypothetical protein